MDTIYLTENAFRDIALETADHPTIETGGILIGEKVGHDWFIVEVIDPGPRSVRSVAYFEYNHSYATHLAKVIHRRYKAVLRLMGLWHRHPGSLDTFSSTDDDTHREYLRLLQGSFISMLVNIDPAFRMTFYRVERGPRYAPVKYVIGDQHFPPALLVRSCATEVVASLSRPTFRELPPPVRRAPRTDTAPMMPPLPTRQEHAVDEVMRVEYQQPLQPVPRAVPSVHQPPPVQHHSPAPQTGPSPADQPRTPGLGRQFLNVVQNFLIPRSEQPEEIEQVHVSPHYRPYTGEQDEPPPQRRASAEQVQLLDMLDAELDYLTEKREVFQFHISPQEPGFRMEVKLLMTPSRPPYPSRVEFMFYYNRGMAVVAVEGREQPYQPGLLRRFYAAYDVPLHHSDPRSDRHPPPGQERPHDGSSQRPRP